MIETTYLAPQTEGNQNLFSDRKQLQALLIYS